MRAVIIVAAAISLLGISEVKSAHGTGGIPAVLAELEQISARIDVLHCVG